MLGNKMHSKKLEVLNDLISYLHNSQGKELESALGGEKKGAMKPVGGMVEIEISKEPMEMEKEEHSKDPMKMMSKKMGIGEAEDSEEEESEDKMPYGSEDMSEKPEMGESEDSKEVEMSDEELKELLKQYLKD